MPKWIKLKASTHVLTPGHLYILSKLHQSKIKSFSYDCQSVCSSELTKKHDHFSISSYGKSRHFWCLPSSPGTTFMHYVNPASHMLFHTSPLMGWIHNLINKIKCLMASHRLLKFALNLLMKTIPCIWFAYYISKDFHIHHFVQGNILKMFRRWSKVMLLLLL